jgi:hypothetical protein
MAAFVAAFRVSRLGPQARAVIAVASQAMDVITEKSLDDEEKQRLVQRAALHLFGQFFLITLTGIVVLAVPGVVMWVGDLIGLAKFAAVTDLLLSWKIIIGATLLILAAGWLGKLL